MWGGGQNFSAYCGLCVCIWTWVLKNFLLVYGPFKQWWGSRVQTVGTPGRPCPYGPLPVRTLPFSCCHASAHNFSKFFSSQFFKNSTFSETLLLPLGWVLGDHLVAIRVLEHPWGPT